MKSFRLKLIESLQKKDSQENCKTYLEPLKDFQSKKLKKLERWWETDDDIEDSDE